MITTSDNTGRVVSLNKTGSIRAIVNLTLSAPTAVDNHVLVVPHDNLVSFVIQHADWSQSGRHAARPRHLLPVLQPHETLQHGVIGRIHLPRDRRPTPAAAVEGVVALRVDDPLSPADLVEVDDQVVRATAPAAATALFLPASVFLSGGARHPAGGSALAIRAHAQCVLLQLPEEGVVEREEHQHGVLVADVAERRYQVETGVASGAATTHADLDGAGVVAGRQHALNYPRQVEGEEVLARAMVHRHPAHAVRHRAAVLRHGHPHSVAPASARVARVASQQRKHAQFGFLHYFARRNTR